LIYFKISSIIFAIKTEVILSLRLVTALYSWFYGTDTPPGAAVPTTCGQLFSDWAFRDRIAKTLALSPIGWREAALELSRDLPALKGPVIENFGNQPEEGSALLLLTFAPDCPINTFVSALENSGNRRAARLIRDRLAPPSNILRERTCGDLFDDSAFLQRIASILARSPCGWKEAAVKLSQVFPELTWNLIQRFERESKGIAARNLVALMHSLDCPVDVFVSALEASSNCKAAQLIRDESNPLPHFPRFNRERTCYDLFEDPLFTHRIVSTLAYSPFGWRAAALELSRTLLVIDGTFIQLNQKSEKRGESAAENLIGLLYGLAYPIVFFANALDKSGNHETALLIREKAGLSPYDQTYDLAPARAQRVNVPGIPKCYQFFNARPWLHEEIALLLSEILPGSETPRWLAAMRDLSQVEPNFNARNIWQYQKLPPEKAADQFLSILGTFCVPLDTFVTALRRSNNSEAARLICNECLILDPQAPPALPAKPAAHLPPLSPAARPAAPKGPPADYVGDFFNSHPAYSIEITDMLVDTPPGGESPAWVVAAEQLSKKYPKITNAVIRQYQRKTPDEAAKTFLSLAGTLRVTLADFVEALSNSGNAEAAHLLCLLAGLPHDRSWIEPAANCGAKPAAPLSSAASPAAPEGPPADYVFDFFKRHPAYHIEIADMLAETLSGGNSPAWVAVAKQLSKKYPKITNAVIRQYKRKIPYAAAETLIDLAGALRVTLKDFVEALSNSGNDKAAQQICNYSGLLLRDMSRIDQEADCGAKPAAPLHPLSPAAGPADPKGPPEGPPADYIGEFFNRHPKYSGKIADMLAEIVPGGNNSPAWVAAAEQLSKKYPKITNAVIRYYQRKPSADDDDVIRHYQRKIPFETAKFLSLAGTLRVTLKDFVEALSNSGNDKAAQRICQYAGLPPDMSWIDRPAANCGALSPAKLAAPLSPAAKLEPQSDTRQKIVAQQQAIFETIAKPAAPVAAPAPAADSIKKDKNECPMCLEEPGGTLWTEGNRKWVLLNCNKDSGHACCSVCVQKLLANKEGCPICRGPITNVITIHFG
jgi:uncharacterized phage-like protein YoqJ